MFHLSSKCLSAYWVLLQRTKFPSQHPHCSSQTIGNSSSRKSSTFFWPPPTLTPAPGMHMVHKYIYMQSRHPDTQNKKSFLLRIKDSPKKVLNLQETTGKWVFRTMNQELALALFPELKHFMCPAVSTYLSLRGFRYFKMILQGDSAQNS